MREGFFQREEVAALLALAARAADVPLAVHRVERNREGPAEASHGGCGACRFVHRVEGGARACGQSRLVASGMALRQRRALAFTCHLGFTCVSAPAVPGEAWALTLGPFRPEGEEAGLEEDVAEGLAALGAGRVVPPLEDVRPARPERVLAVASWAGDGLAALWAEAEAAEQTEETAEEEDVEEAPGRARRRDGATREDPLDGATIAAAVAGGNQPQARELLRTVLSEGRQRSATRVEESRARVVAAVGASLEALARTGLAESAWAGMPAFLDAVARAEDEKGLLDAAMAVLGPARRQAAPARPGKTPPLGRVSASFPRLNAILTRRLDAALTLEEVARELGETPSAISHRLKSKFGMGFSEYRGRLRVDKAKELLRRTKLSATEVARRVGIADQSNFGKLFRKFEGMSPLEYRRQHGRR